MRIRKSDMRTQLFLILGLLLGASLTVMANSTSSQSGSGSGANLNDWADLKLWYKHPAAKWTEALAEILLQSHEGELAFLPALPAAWSEGAVEGLCARGGFEVSWRWEKGVAKSATIKSKLGKTCRIREERQSVLHGPGNVSRNLYPKNGFIEFETTPGQTYMVAFGVGVLITR